jgi:hypothetical protein
VELKGIAKKLLDERGDANKCLKCGKDNHKWFECWSKEPVTTKVAAGAKRKAQKEPKEEKAEDKPSKKSKTASAKRRSRQLLLRYLTTSLRYQKMRIWTRLGRSSPFVLLKVAIC